MNTTLPAVLTSLSCLAESVRIGSEGVTVAAWLEAPAVLAGLAQGAESVGVLGGGVTVTALLDTPALDVTGGSCRTGGVWVQGEGVAVTALGELWLADTVLGTRSEYCQ